MTVSNIKRITNCKQVNEYDMFTKKYSVQKCAEACSAKRLHDKCGFIKDYDFMDKIPISWRENRAPSYNRTKNKACFEAHKKEINACIDKCIPACNEKRYTISSESDDYFAKKKQGHVTRLKFQFKVKLRKYLLQTKLDKKIIKKCFWEYIKSMYLKNGK